MWGQVTNSRHLGVMLCIFFISWSIIEGVKRQGCCLPREKQQAENKLMMHWFWDETMLCPEARSVHAECARTTHLHRAAAGSINITEWAEGNTYCASACRICQETAERNMTMCHNLSTVWCVMITAPVWRLWCHCNRANDVSVVRDELFSVLLCLYCFACTRKTLCSKLS